AAMTAAMLDEGAAGRSALELADEVDVLGADLSTGAGEHTASVSLHVPVTRLEPALAVMADVVLRPDFPAAELDRQRIDRLTEILQWRDEPAAIAGVEFDRTLYGASHPYGVPNVGTAASLAAMTVGDLQAFHDRHYRPGGATLVVVGDVTGEAVLPLLERAFGGWQGSAQALPEEPPVEQVAERRILLVDKPGAEQSEIRIGRIGAARLTDDYFPLVVMNTILGGSFTSRLNQNLREDKGYSYGAFSGFAFRPWRGPFLAAAAVQTEVTAEALTEFVRELRRILERVAEDELERARNYVALGFPSTFQTVAGTAGALGELALYDLPDDYFDRYIERVLAVTAEDVQRVAAEYLDPDRVAIVVVGDLERIEAPVRALGLGPVETLSVEDVLGPAPVVTRR
ncbi:MAG TPA: pitrilysin family protein, partial [Gemmatimonadota bacterium]|nr:pitrilysin family protein [Gemmatimonadota bacterium]